MSITPRERSLSFSEDTCLNNIAFWSEAVGVPDIFCSKAPPEDSWQWVFEFMSGFRVYVQAQTIEVMKGPNNASEATRYTARFNAGVRRNKMIADSHATR